jgi:5-methyltetrahydrofolate--homocysteine methyltransferase
LSEVLPLFDKRIFRMTWGLKGEEAPELVAEAQALLERAQQHPEFHIRLSLRFFDATREGDAIRLDADTLLPMLRQEEGAGRSLADFVPAEGSGPLGIFALSVHDADRHPEGCTCEACHNEYEQMLRRAVKVTLAEATSKWLDKQLSARIRRPDVKVVKPAAGYASFPDHSLKRDILRLLPEADSLGITLTDSCAMKPAASICGLVLVHPEAAYPDIRHISQAQYGRYAAARGFSPDEARLFLSHLL